MGKTGRNDPCACGSGRKFKKCHGGSSPVSSVSAPAAPAISGGELLRAIRVQGFSVSQDFQDTAQLRRLGPVIRGEWRLAPEDESRVAAAGGVVSPPVKGYFLIDTGASFTGIDAGVARELNLRPVRRTEAFGIGGSGMFEMVSANMLLYVGDVRGDRVAIGLFKDFVCAPGLRETHDAYNLTAADGSPLRIIGLLGRDFLRFATLTYNGLSGHWDMKINPSVMQPWEGV
jgi:SEC-C motif